MKYEIEKQKVIEKITDVELKTALAARDASDDLWPVAAAISSVTAEIVGKMHADMQSRVNVALGQQSEEALKRIIGEATREAVGKKAEELLKVAVDNALADEFAALKNALVHAANTAANKAADRAAAAAADAVSAQQPAPAAPQPTVTAPAPLIEQIAQTAAQQAAQAAAQQAARSAAQQAAQQAAEEATGRIKPLRDKVLLAFIAAISFAAAAGYGVGMLHARADLAAAAAELAAHNSRCAANSGSS